MFEVIVSETREVVGMFDTWRGAAGAQPVAAARHGRCIIRRRGGEQIARMASAVAALREDFAPALIAEGLER